MRIFRLFNKPTTSNKELLDLINTYIIANDIKNAQVMYGKCSKKVAQKIHRDFFGRYKDTSWGIPSNREVKIIKVDKIENGNSLVIWKLLHGEFKLSHEISLPLGEEIVQEWEVEKGTNIVLAIKDIGSAYD